MNYFSKFVFEVLFISDCIIILNFVFLYQSDMLIDLLKLRFLFLFFIFFYSLINYLTKFRQIITISLHK